MSVCFGAHISTSKGIVNAIKYCKNALKGDILQIFSQSPRSLKGPTKKTLSEAKKIKKELQKNNIKIVSHSPYTINLAKNIETHKYMVDCLIKDLEFVNSISGIGSVVHMGKSVNLSTNEALKNMMLNIKYILSKYNGKSKLIIETSCGQGSELLSKLEDIGTFYNEGVDNLKFTSDEKKRISFCIDTCHIFVAGYDMRDINCVENYFNLFDKLIGIDKLDLIHFNDSSKEFNSNVDRHANIGSGYIGNPDKGGNIEGLKRVYDYGKKFKIPMVLETENIEPYVELIKKNIWKFD